MDARRLQTALPRAYAIAVAAIAAGVFVRAGLGATHGTWPAPLDDVFIHYDFARSAARGHPMSWFVGSGYSSGATSPIYPLVLALGYLVGLHGTNLGAFACLVAVLSVSDFAVSIARASRSKAAVWVAPVVVVAVPLLDWSWWSGMEIAFGAMLLGRAIASAERAWRGEADRSKHQLRAGIFLALLALDRPECAVLAPLFAVSIARGAGPSNPWLALARSLGPTVFALGLFAALNLAFTGELAAAGALRKLATEDPLASGPDVAALALKNLAELRTLGLDIPLGGRIGSSIVLALALAGAVLPRSRALALPLVLGGAGALLLVCLNTTAPYQNMRYVAPTLAMWLAAAILGASALAARGKPFALGAGAALAAFIALASEAFPQQIDHFARASKNIAEQQVEVGRRLGAMHVGRVFLSDAGAIPFLSDRPAIDGLGLGGTHGLPFARASVQGAAAVIELIERLPPNERPDTLAIYDAWWPGVGEHFGHPLFDVTIADNVICADPTKRVYAADWSLLEDRSAPHLDRLDVGDLVDERAHDFDLPRVHVGYVVSDVLLDGEGARRWDAGRIVPEGERASFTLRGDFARGPHTLSVRSDDRAPPSVWVSVDGVSLSIDGAAPHDVTLTPADDAWSETRIELDDVGPGARVVLTPEGGALRLFAIALD